VQSKNYRYPRGVLVKLVSPISVFNSVRSMEGKERQKRWRTECSTCTILYKKRPLSTVGEKAHVKRPFERHHLSFPFLAESQAPPRVDLFDECGTARLDTGSLNSFANLSRPWSGPQGQPYPTMYEGEEWKILRILDEQSL